MVTRPWVALQLDVFVDGRLSPSTEVQYVRHYVDVIQLYQKSAQYWHMLTGHRLGSVPLYLTHERGL